MVLPTTSSLLKYLRATSSLMNYFTPIIKVSECTVLQLVCKQIENKPNRQKCHSGTKNFFTNPDVAIGCLIR
jgi:hypothetical protein